MLCRSGDELCLRMEDGGRNEGGTKTSWISGTTLLLYSVICRNCLKGMALAISCARTAKYLGCKHAKNYHLRKNAPNKTGTKSGGLDPSLSGRSTPGTLSLRYGNRPDSVMLFCSRHDVVHLYLFFLSPFYHWNSVIFSFLFHVLLNRVVLLYCCSLADILLYICTPFARPLPRIRETRAASHILAAF